MFSLILVRVPHFLVPKRKYKMATWKLFWFVTSEYKRIWTPWGASLVPPWIRRWVSLFKFLYRERIQSWTFSSLNKTKTNELTKYPSYHVNPNRNYCARVLTSQLARYTSLMV